MRPTIALISLVFLVSCTQPDRYAVPPAAPTDRIGIGYRSVEVRQVTLPAYAETSDIYTEGAGGALSPIRGAVWADAPGRALTLELSRLLGQITRVQVAPEPWPFDEPAAAQVDVRVEEILARADATFRLSGQYFVAARDGSGRDRARLFQISIPIAADGGPQANAAARSAAVAELARDIARRGLR